MRYFALMQGFTRKIGIFENAKMPPVFEWVA
jgi:hypothetical protein